jgi:hypothetical protein
MSSSSLTLPARIAEPSNDQPESMLPEAPRHRLAPARGSLMGILLGGGLWVAMFATASILKH